MVRYRINKMRIRISWLCWQTIQKREVGVCCKLRRQKCYPIFNTDTRHWSAFWSGLLIPGCAIILQVNESYKIIRWFESKKRMIYSWGKIEIPSSLVLCFNIHLLNWAIDCELARTSSLLNVCGLIRGPFKRNWLLIRRMKTKTMKNCWRYGLNQVRPAILYWVTGTSLVLCHFDLTLWVLRDEMGTLPIADGVTLRFGEHLGYGGKGVQNQWFGSEDQWREFWPEGRQW